MIKDILKKIPGFRTGSKWKMVLAVVIYFFIIILLLNPTGATPRDKVLDTLIYLMAIGVPFVLISNLGNIRSKLPLFRRRTVKANILGAVIVFIIIGMGMGIVDNLKSPEQKQLELVSAQQLKDKATAEEVADDINNKIKELGEIDSIKIDEVDDIVALRNQYDELSIEQKELVTSIDLLELAENKIKNMGKEVALDIDDKIIGLGEVEDLTLDKEMEVIAVRDDYEELSFEQKDLVLNTNLLESAENKIEDMKKEVALDIEDKIIALEETGAIKLDKEKEVIDLRNSYEKLSFEQKEIVTNIDLLESAEKKMEDLKVEYVFDKIKEIGRAEYLTVDKEDNVVSARNVYNDLNSKQKELVTNLALLESAEIKIEELKIIEKKEAEKVEAKTKAEDRAEEDYKNWVSNQFSLWDGSNTYLVKLLKENLNDPKSFEHVETLYSDNGDHIIVKMTYRANNAFGALILQNVTAKADYVTQTITAISYND